MKIYIVLEQITNKFIGVRTNHRNAQRLMNSGNSLNMIIQRTIK